MGKWEIRLYFSAQNMVVLPIEHDVVQKVFALETQAAKGPMSHNFHQVDEDFIWINPAATGAPGNADDANKKWSVHVETMRLENVEMNTAQFQLRMDILEMLKQKYLSEKPLTFPVSTIQIARFTGCPEQTPDHQHQQMPINIVLCQAINNCDTLFILPFRSPTQHTTCTNPRCTGLQLHAGEYGSYPTQPFDTYSTYTRQNIRYVNSVADALNVNASELTSFSKDVSRTFVPTPNVHGGTPAKAASDGYCGDRTNFFIPFPFSTDEDFQGGLSSPSSNINFKITGTLNYDDTANNVPAYTVKDERSFNTPWVAAFLIDGVIMIRPDPGSDAAKVIWSDRTVC